MIVPFPPGGPTDTIARIITERMRVSLGRLVIIENVGGAGGSIGVGHVAHAAPDGYTLSIGHIRTHVFNAAILKLDYDVVKDFAPISLIADTPNWIVVDIIRMENGLLAEHWDVIQDEVTKEASVSGLPMFGDSFPS